MCGFAGWFDTGEQVKVIHHYDVAWAERWGKHLLNIGAEDIAIHGPIEDLDA